jgi:hypothetical protein
MFFSVSSTQTFKTAIDLCSDDLANLHKEKNTKTKAQHMFSEITWKKVSDAIASLSSDYDTTFSICKQSGKHEQKLPVPFKDYLSNWTILYFHLLVFEIKDILSKVTSEYESPKTIH